MWLEILHNLKVMLLKFDISIWNSYWHFRRLLTVIEVWNRRSMQLPNCRLIVMVKRHNFSFYELRYQRSRTQDMLDTILSIQPKESGGGGGETREASVYRQSKEMLDKLPGNFDPVEVKERWRYFLYLNNSRNYVSSVMDLVRPVLKTIFDQECICI